MFSRPVVHVAGTRIFARRDGSLQHLVYAMRFGADDDLAMVLPIPVPPRSPEDAVRFVSLEGYADFFDDVNALFPVVMARGRDKSLGFAPQASNTLEVHRVGAFEASFVPRLADFDRLDARFRLSGEVWDQLPQYADWGFAVFKLRREEGFLKRLMRRPESREVHPMAFTFPSRDPERLFFPTVHVHDGEVHARAAFDHQLYAQSARALDGFDVSPDPARAKVRVDDAQGLVLGDSAVWRRTMGGVLDNADVWV